MSRYLIKSVLVTCLSRYLIHLILGVFLLRHLIKLILGVFFVKIFDQIDFRSTSTLLERLARECRKAPVRWLPNDHESLIMMTMMMILSHISILFHHIEPAGPSPCANTPSPLCPPPPPPGRKSSASNVNLLPDLDPPTLLPPLQAGRQSPLSACPPIPSPGWSLGPCCLGTLGPPCWGGTPTRCSPATASPPPPPHPQIQEHFLAIQHRSLCCTCKNRYSLCHIINLLLLTGCNIMLSIFGPAAQSI